MSDPLIIQKRTAPATARSVVHSIARAIGEGVIPAGDRAALRRTPPGEVGGSAFWKIAIRYLEPNGLLGAGNTPESDHNAAMWSTIISAIAAGPPLGTLSLGHALAGAHVTEARVLRLLKATDSVLLDTVRTITHQLSAEGSSVDWGDIAELVLSDGHQSSDFIRRRIAYDYYRSTEKKTSTMTKEVPS